MNFAKRMSAVLVALTLGLAACSGSDIASPGASNPGTLPGGGGGGGPGGPGAGVCPSNFPTHASSPLNGRTICTLPSLITSNLTIPNVAGVAYRLVGRTEVGVDTGPDGNTAGGAPATLTVQSGVTIFGASGSDFLLINRGSRLVADGDLTAPIVFTSESDILDAVDPVNSVGDWGGIVILGQAPISVCLAGGTPGTANCQNRAEGISGDDRFYGGADPEDDSGVLNYVRVQYAGFPVPGIGGNELNGITFGGVGRGTQVDFVQVHNNRDDGIELFGGTVNMKHIVLTGIRDDAFDTDFGYTGHVQFVVARQSGGTVAERLWEASQAASQPTMANFTFVGLPGGTGEALQGFTFNSGSNGRILNGVLDTDGSCLTLSSAGTVLVDSVMLGCPTAPTGAALTAVNAGANNVVQANTTLNGVLPGPDEIAMNADALNPASVNSFFSAAQYVGAFSPTETLTNNWAAGWTIQLFPAPACPAGTTQAAGQVNGQRVCNLTGTVTTNVTLVQGNLYRLNGRVEIGVDVGADGAAVGGDPASLTVASGVTVFGDGGQDFLLVNRGSQLITNGTRTQPVVFTSLPDLLNTQSDPINAFGEWGGIVILGRAPISVCLAGGTPGTVSCQNRAEGISGDDRFYGGATDADNSGRLNYTVVKFAGFPVPGVGGNELNGITFGGVGSGTEVEFVQVHNNRDDGVEFFGGSVNVRYLVLTGIRDDSLDTDFGYDGFMQFIIVEQRGPIAERLIEASQAASNPIFANFTFIGLPAPPAAGEALQGATFNGSSGGRLVNGVITTAGTCLNFTASVFPLVDGLLLDCPVALDANAAAAVAAGTGNTQEADTLTGTFINGPAETGHAFVNVSTLPAFFQQPNYLGDTPNYIGAVRNSSDTWWTTWTCGLPGGTAC